MSHTRRWLKKQTEYPKILIGDKAAAGCTALFDKIPKDKPVWGGVEFDGPWQAFWQPKVELIDDEEIFYEGSAEFPKRPLMEQGGEITQEQWVKNIDQCIHWIKQGLINKVVMARCMTVDVPALDPFDVLSNLSGGIPYMLQLSPDVTFLGCTPEHLFKRDGDRLQTEALAGTSKNPSELLSSRKDLAEFEWVLEDIQEKLGTICDDIKHAPVGTKKTNDFYHLHSSFEAKLHGHIGDHDVLSLLHPTPAMGGTPWCQARKTIKQLEPFRRGWYAAPMGYYTKEQSEAIVCIRCALIIKNRMHLFSGTGIVEESDPYQEWDELNHKCEAWLCKIPVC